MFALAWVPGCAWAHPIDEVVQGAYLTLAPGEVRLELDLSPGPQVAGVLLKSMDTNSDRIISDAEAMAYGERVLKQEILTLDGVGAALQLQRVETPPYRNLEQAGDTIKIYAIGKRSERAGARTLVFENRYQPVQSQCTANIFLQPAGGWSYQVNGQQRSDDGRSLTVRYTTSSR